jgi:hypothetical protein
LGEDTQKVVGGEKTMKGEINIFLFASIVSSLHSLKKAAIKRSNFQGTHPTRVARFILVQYTKTGKIYQITTKSYQKAYYIKCP